jgi:hypothetical protein
VPGWPRQIVLETAISKTSKSKMDWKCGSSGRMPVCRFEALKSNPSPSKRKKKNC